MINFFLSGTVTCKSDQFKCGSSSVCVQKSKVCDGRRDCPNGEDEQANCSKLSIDTVRNLHVILKVPSHRKAKLGNLVGMCESCKNSLSMHSHRPTNVFANPSLRHLSL